MRPAESISFSAPDVAHEPCTIGLQNPAELRPLNDAQTSWCHVSAVIDPSLEVGDGVLIGPYAVVGERVSLGDGTRVATHAIIDGWTRIGRNCRIFSSAVLGSIPQDLKYSGAATLLEIGDDNTVREFVTLNRATDEGGRTVIGNGNLIMAYVHIAHDCIIGDGTILANAVTLAGHVTIEDRVAVGGLTAVHQFVRIGRQSFVGGASRVIKDVPPFVRAAGNPLRVVGLNSVGLERQGVSEDVRQELKRAYRLLYRSNCNVSQAIERIRDELEPMAEIKTLVDFVSATKRGVI